MKERLACKTVNRSSSAPPAPRERHRPESNVRGDAEGCDGKVEDRVPRTGARSMATRKTARRTSPKDAAESMSTLAAALTSDVASLKRGLRYRICVGEELPGRHK